MSEKTERRRNSRKSIEFFVQEHQGDRTFLHPAINLSTDGIYFLAASGRKIIDGESIMQLEFALPTGQEIKATGRIVHVFQSENQLGVGVRFESFVEGTAHDIERFLSA